LWINLVTDTLPALALGMEQAEKGIMDKRPRNPRAGIFEEGLGGRIAIVGLLIGILALSAYRLGLQYGLEVARTQTFMVLSLSQLFHAQNVRSDTDSLFKTGVFTNKYLAGAIVFSILLQFGVILIPFMREIFKVTVLDQNQLFLVIGLSMVPVLVTELMKLAGKLARK
jgi:P-type Ca2+ transporter type 2C